LRLIHVELTRHGLHLPRLFAQILLIYRQLLSDLRPRLARKNILELHVQLFLFLDEQILLNNLFSFRNQALL